MFYTMLLQVVNEMKAKRSKILTNVGFRRQLVRFARCRGLLDRVERPSSRRSPRLEPGGETTPRGATPSKDAKDEVNVTELTCCFLNKPFRSFPLHRTKISVGR